jgi:hypothetical protein
MNRRDFIVRLTVLSAAPAALVACSGGGDGGLQCTDVSQLTGAQAQARSANMYIDHSARPENCGGCTFFQAGAANACGSCTVVQGPINPAGYCNLFSARS